MYRERERVAFARVPVHARVLVLVSTRKGTRCKLQPSQNKAGPTEPPAHVDEERRLTGDDCDRPIGRNCAYGMILEGRTRVRRPGSARSRRPRLGWRRGGDKEIHPDSY